MNINDSQKSDDRRKYMAQKQQEFRERHKRISFFVTKEAYQDLEKWYAQNPIEPSLQKQVRSLVMNLHERDAYVDALAAMPDKETLSQLLFNVRQLGNNLNQIAALLNQKAKADLKVEVANYEKSKTILHECYDILRGVEDEFLKVSNP